MNITTIEDFEKIYRDEYRQEMDAADRWIKWCFEQNDSHGMNFHQGKKSAHIFHNIQMEQLLRTLMLDREFRIQANKLLDGLQHLRTLPSMGQNCLKDCPRCAWEKLKGAQPQSTPDQSKL